MFFFSVGGLVVGGGGVKKAFLSSDATEKNRL